MVASLPLTSLDPHRASVFTREKGLWRGVGAIAAAIGENIHPWALDAFTEFETTLVNRVVAIFFESLPGDGLLVKESWCRRAAALHNLFAITYALSESTVNIMVPIKTDECETTAGVPLTALPYILCWSMRLTLQVDGATLCASYPRMCRPPVRCREAARARALARRSCWRRRTRSRAARREGARCLTTSGRQRGTTHCTHYWTR